MIISYKAVGRSLHFSCIVNFVAVMYVLQRWTIAYMHVSVIVLYYAMLYV